MVYIVRMVLAMRRRSTALASSSLLIHGVVWERWSSRCRWRGGWRTGAGIVCVGVYVCVCV